MNPIPQSNPIMDSSVSRRGFIKGTLAAGVVAGGGLGAFYFGYEKAIGNPLRVGVIGTGDEGSVLLGAINPDMIQVRSIADIRPYNVWRAFHGDHSSDTIAAIRPGLMAKYGWKTESEARRHVTVYEKGDDGGDDGRYDALINNAKKDGLEAVIIALPLHLHAPAAVAAMKAGLHVITEKLMAHSVHECKEMARLAQQADLILAVGHQRHYNILYENAVAMIRQGMLGELHYIRAQWHRGNLPGNDSWQQPLPENAKPGDKQAKRLAKELKDWRDAKAATAAKLPKAKDKEKAALQEELNLWTKKIAQREAQIADEILKDTAKNFGYEDLKINNDAGKVVYERPAIEELIRWRLWDRTGAGLMAELGSHQLDAASIFVAAAHKAHGGKNEHPHPLNVAAVGTRPLFPSDRDVEDHVYCFF
jgi:hypothetical protein